MFPSGEISIDSFAGGGGASEGHRLAFGIDPDVAINHDPEAIAMHRANHPGSRHLCQSVYRADPRDVAGDKPVGLLWASPDCKHFSKAKGGQPLNKNIRDLAWVVVHYAERLPKWQKPRVIALENVEEFLQWCDLIQKLDAKGRPVFKDGSPVMVPDRTKIDLKGLGNIFRRWVARLKKQGYVVEWMVLRAADYDTPTIRKRLFVIARRDGRPIVWPEATNGKPDSLGVKAGKLKPWRPAAEILDFTLDTPSIFLSPEEAALHNCKRPLAENTMARIAAGIQRYVIDNPNPFIVPITHSVKHGPFDGRFHPGHEPLRTITGANGGELALVSPFVTKFRAGAVGASSLEPVPTVTANSFHKKPGGAVPLGLVAAFLAQHNTGVVGHHAVEPVSSITQTGSHQNLVTAFLLNQKGSDQRMAGADEPLRSQCAGGNHAAAVYAFMCKFYGEGGQWQPANDPLHTIPTKDRFGLVTVTIAGQPYVIVDIGMRMLTPRELFLAQGFRRDYLINQGLFVIDGPTGQVTGWRPLTKASQIRMCGNSVCPPLAEAILRANLPEFCAIRERKAA